MPQQRGEGMHGSRVSLPTVRSSLDPNPAPRQQAAPSGMQGMVCSGVQMEGWDVPSGCILLVV
jgi:hypothetical protein